MNLWTANSIHTFEGGYLSIYDLITKGFGAGGAKFQGFGAGGDGFSQSYYPGAANSIHTLELEVPGSNNLKVIFQRKCHNDLITKGFGAGGARFQGFGAGGDGFSQSYYPGAANSIHTLELEVPSSNNLKVNPNKNKTQRLSKLSKFTVINI